MSTTMKTTVRSTESGYKKSTSGEAPVNNHDHGTTPEAVSRAEVLFEMIGTGPGRAVRRPKDPRTDRALRRLIAEANKKGDCIINVGGGYYRAGEDDEPAVRRYLLANYHRAKEINETTDAMREAYYGRY